MQGKGQSFHAMFMTFFTGDNTNHKKNHVLFYFNKFE